MLYAALLGILLITLSWGVSKVRLREHVSLGAGEVSDLESAIRAHGNFIEYVPFALILLMLAESAVTPSWLLHALGGSLLAGRLLHAYGIRQPGSTNNYRKIRRGPDLADDPRHLFLHLRCPGGDSVRVRSHRKCGTTTSRAPHKSWDPWVYLPPAVPAATDQPPRGGWYAPECLHCHRLHRDRPGVVPWPTQKDTISSLIPAELGHSISRSSCAAS